MFECKLCHKTFVRKDSLLRHIKTLHSRSDVRDLSLNNDVHIQNQFGNTNSHYLFNSLNKQISNDIESKTLSVQDDLSESVYDADNTGRNSTDEDISQVLHDNNGNKVTKSKDEKEGFDCRMLAATEAIKQKFNSLRNSRNEIQDLQSMNLTRKNQEEAFMNIAPENNNAVKIEAKFPQLLQCLLDILLIKELQNVNIRDKQEEEEGDGEHRDVKLKRTLNSINDQGNENEIKLIKRFKYNNSLEHNSDNNNSSTNSECVEKFWHNPSTLVGELRNLMTTTDIGQQIYTIMHRLNKINIKTTNYFEYKAHKENQNNLLRKLNELKKTSVGRQIRCIFRELVKAEIIEPIDYITNGDEYNSDEEENDNNFY